MYVYIWLFFGTLNKYALIEKFWLGLFLGVEGGFQTDDKKFEFEEVTSIVILPQWLEVPFPDAQLPDEVGLNYHFSCQNESSQDWLQ